MTNSSLNSQSVSEKLIEKLSQEDGISLSQVEAEFKFLISPSTTSDVDARLMALAIKNYIFREIKQMKFDSPISGIVIFPIIYNPKIRVREDFTSYKWKEKSFFVGLPINFEKWVNASLPVKFNLLTDNLIHSLEKIPKKHLFEADKFKFISLINNSGDYFLSKKDN